MNFKHKLFVSFITNYKSLTVVICIANKSQLTNITVDTITHVKELDIPPELVIKNFTAKHQEVEIKCQTRNVNDKYNQ